MPICTEIRILKTPDSDSDLHPTGVVLGVLDTDLDLTVWTRPFGLVLDTCESELGVNNQRIILFPNLSPEQNRSKSME